LDFFHFNSPAKRIYVFYRIARNTASVGQFSCNKGRTYGVRGIVSIPLSPDSKGGCTWTLTPTVEYLHSDRSEDRLWTQNGVIRGTLAQPETRRWAAGVGLMAIW
jgi:hypothetical protein